ncbi:hypothetical protein IT412_05620 [Candidatus Peregrinibacteria bacterium]|nr:hypothetical protein [Candidatus Peregrinibacteria bacterium]
MSSPNPNTRIIATSHETVHYEVPASPSQKSDSIPTDYLRERVNYATNRLLERLEISTSKHLSERLDPVSESIQELKERLLGIIENLPTSQISSQTELNTFCEKVQASIYLFKSDRQRYLKHISQLAEIFYKTEQDVLATLFDLPRESVNPPTDNTRGYKKDIDRINEKLAFTNLCKDSILADLRSPADIKNFKDQIDLAFQSYSEISELLSKFPDQESLNKVPKNVAKAIMDAIREFVSKLEKLIQHQQELADLIHTLTYHNNVLEEASKAETYFRGLVMYKNQQGLSILLTELQNNLQNSNYLKNRISEAIKSTQYLIELSDLLFGESQFINIVLQAANYTPDFQNEFSETINKFKQSQTSLNSEKPATPSTENGIPTPEIIAPTTPTTKTINRASSPYFKWKTASLEEAKEEIIARLLEIPKLTILRYLYTNQKWDDLGRLLKYIGFEHLSQVSLVNLVGKNRMFQDIPSMIKIIFPEIPTDQAQHKVSIRTVSNDKRFSWHGSNTQQEDKRNEVRRRMQEYWPLINELYLEGGTQIVYLHELLRLMNKKDFMDAGLNISCFGKENSVYPTIEDLIEDVFSKK